jgi:CheY-like chemotaxis protein
MNDSAKPARKANLLIVDDSPTSRQIIRNHLLRHRRIWGIYESDNGHDAMRMMSLVNPDFVTMDVNMPQMSGLEAAEKIRKDFPSTRIALITANVQDAVVRRAAELGFAFIEKPIKEASILKAIEFFESVEAKKNA